MSGNRKIGNSLKINTAPMIGRYATFESLSMNGFAACLLGSCLGISGAAQSEGGAVFSEDRAPGTVFKDCEFCPDMVVIPAGWFDAEISAPKIKAGRKPIPKLPIDIQSFAIGRTEVTQGQWKAVMDSNPSKFIECGDDCPVERVSWNDALEYIHRLNAKTGKNFRLPSEIEWRYACRAGGTNKYCGSESIDTVAWYEGNSGNTTHQVARKQPNAWGLYDMTGNVWEWTLGCEVSKYGKAKGIVGVPTIGGCKGHSAYGGSWGDLQQLMQTAHQNGRIAKSRAYDVVSKRSDFGLRLATSLR